MINKLINYKYSILLLSCLITLLTAPLWPNAFGREVINWFVFSFNVFAGLLLILRARGVLMKLLRILGGVLIVILTVDFIMGDRVSFEIFPLLYVLYFVSISAVVYKDIYTAKRVDTEMIAAVFCGFIILGLLSTFTCLYIDRVQPGSFSGIPAEGSSFEDGSSFDDFSYFSFITLLTIGYGDMAPLKEASRTATLLIGLVGHFYTVIVMGVVIGKYLVGYNPDE